MSTYSYFRPDLPPVQRYFRQWYVTQHDMSDPTLDSNELFFKLKSEYKSTYKKSQIRRHDKHFKMRRDAVGLVTIGPVLYKCILVKVIL